MNGAVQNSNPPASRPLHWCSIVGENPYLRYQGSMVVEKTHAKVDSTSMYKVSAEISSIVEVFVQKHWLVCRALPVILSGG